MCVHVYNCIGVEKYDTIITQRSESWICKEHMKVMKVN